MNKTDEGGLSLNDDDRLRFTNTTRHLSSLAKFLLWGNSMAAFFISFYSSKKKSSASTRIIKLDSSLSARFVVTESDIEGDDTVFFGVQAHEKVWLTAFPWSGVIYDDDSLFFLYEPQAVMGMPTMPILCVAFPVPHVDARRVIQKKRILRFFPIFKVENGRVVDYGAPLREKHPITYAKDVVKYLLERQAVRQQKTKATTALL